MPKILVIEDDPFNVELFELTLQRLGNFETIATDKGDEIISLLNSEKVDLIILDVSLDNTYINNQKYNGVELSKYIKSNSNWSKIPIIVVTAYAGDDDISRILKESRAEKCIKKPITNYNEFIKLIKGYIS